MTEHVPREPLLAVETVLPILDRISIFGGLDESQLFKVFQRLKLVHYEDGEEIFCAGDAASYIYIVHTGAVRLVFDNGVQLIPKAELEAGACFGETSVIGIQPHSATAVSVGHSDLLVLSGETLNEFFDIDQTLFSMLILNIARESCRRLYITNHQLMEYLHRHPQDTGADTQGY